jgi:hypothetical protein
VPWSSEDSPLCEWSLRDAVLVTLAPDVSLSAHLDIQVPSDSALTTEIPTPCSPP